MLPPLLVASEPVKAMEQGPDEVHRLELYFTPEYYRLVSEDSLLAGPSFGLGFDYELTEKWAVGAEVKHAYSSGGFTGLFIGTNLKGRYAVTGSFWARQSELRVSNWAVVNQQQFHQGGIRAEVQITSYSIFTSQSEIPFTGFGFAGMYEQPLGETFSFEPGLALDFTSNAKQSVQSTRFFLRAKMRI